jgi:hypothetical protein
MTFRVLSYGFVSEKHAIKILSHNVYMTTRSYIENKRFYTKDGSEGSADTGIFASTSGLLSAVCSASTRSEAVPLSCASVWTMLNVHPTKLKIVTIIAEINIIITALYSSILDIIIYL